MLRSRFRDFDWTLLGFVLILCVLSVTEIRSATAMTKFHGFQYKQMGFLLIGFVLMFGASLLDYHRLLDLVPWAYGISVFCLIAVKAVGQKVLGARRWINLGGGVHFQPSEWVKLVLILAAARFFWTFIANKRPLRSLDVVKAFALIGVPMLLVLAQPDLGTALTYSPVLLVGLFLGGLRWKQAGVLLLGFLLLVGGIWKSGKVLEQQTPKVVDRRAIA